MRIAPWCLALPLLVLAARPVAADAPAKTPATPPAAQESGERPDYWKDVPFTRANFDEVREQAKKRYLDPTIDETWAFARAASFLLASNAERPLLLLPETFYRARKDDARERGRLAGRVLKIADGDGFVVVEPAMAAPAVVGRPLSPDDLARGRDWQAVRARDLRAAWTSVGFRAGDLDRVMAFAQREFSGAKDWTEKTAWIEASQGFLASLDRHCALVAKRAWEDSTGRAPDAGFEGIGAILTQPSESPWTIVESPIEGQPADRAGLRAGDAVVEVDGRDTRNQSLSRVVSWLRGPKGTSVVVTLVREGEPDRRKVTVVRGHSEVKNVQATPLAGHGGFGYVKITGFVRTTSNDLATEVARLVKLAPGGLRGLVLDLRNNSGGLLNQGIQVADAFMKSGTIVKVKGRRADDNEDFSAAAGEKWDFPLVVVVNAGTASAAEIVASALQDNQRALVVGDRTFGKATVQTLFSPLLQDDYYIKLTVAGYTTPSGRSLEATGVHPDIAVAPDKSGKMPIGFRSENLAGQARTGADYVSANKDLAERVKKCADKAKRSGPDWQLNYAGAALECVIADHRAP